MPDPTPCVVCRKQFRVRRANRSATNNRTICYSCGPEPGDTLSCLACGRTFTYRQGSHSVCSAACNKRRRYAYEIQFINCEICARLVTIHGHQLRLFKMRGMTTCSDPCGREWRRRRSREYQARNYGNGIAKRLARRNTALRRARLAGVQVESFSHDEIFERDNYRCGLCGRKTDRSATSFSPRAPVLDHIVPIAAGGEHTRANVQCACCQCNGIKGARVNGDGEQLRLIG